MWHFPKTSLLRVLHDTSAIGKPLIEIICYNILPSIDKCLFLIFHCLCFPSAFLLLCYDTLHFLTFCQWTCLPFSIQSLQLYCTAYHLLKSSHLAKLIWQEELLSIILGNSFPIANGLCYKVNDPLYFHSTVHPPNEMTKLTAGQTDNYTYETETSTTSPGCQTKRGSRMKVNIWKSLKTHAFSLLPTPSLTSQLLSSLNTTSSISPKCIHLFPSLWQYCRPLKFFTGYRLLTGLFDTKIAILWN